MPAVKKQKVVKKKVARTKKSNNVVDRIEAMNFDDDDGIKINIYGKSGTGKTTLWSTFPGPILAIVCSGSSKPGELRSIDTPANRKKIQTVTIKNSSEIKELVEYQEKTGKFQTIVLDHVSGLQDYCLKEILGLEELPAQMGWGVAQQQDWGQCALQTKEILRALLGLSCNVAIIAQEREFNVDSENSDLIMPYVASALSPSTVGWLSPAVDYIVQTFIQNKTTTSVKTVGNKEIKKTTKAKGVDYCLRVGPDEVYTTKFRTPQGITDDVLLSPTYGKILNLIKGKS